MKKKITAGDVIVMAFLLLGFLAFCALAGWGFIGLFNLATGACAA